MASVSPGRAWWPLPASAARPSSSTHCARSARGWCWSSPSRLTTRSATARSPACGRSPRAKPPGSSPPPRIGCGCPLNSGLTSKCSKSKSAGAIQQQSSGSSPTDYRDIMTEASPAPLAAEPSAAPVRWSFRIEAGAAALFFSAMRALPLDIASAIGGGLARWIGPRLGVSNRARRNLHAAIPELSGTQIEAIVRGMWDNLGRVAAEYPHLRHIRVFPPDGRVETLGIEHLDQALADGRRVILFGGHLGNWEGAAQIGRASCRERGEISVVAASLKK